MIKAAFLAFVLVLNCFYCPLAFADVPSHLVAAHNAIKAGNYNGAVTILKKHAAAGCPYSAALLGKMHKDGIGVKPDAGAAVKWFTKAANNGKKNLAEAQLELGKMYLEGCREIRPEGLKAKRWLSMAADNGMKEATDLLHKVPGEGLVEKQVQDFRARAAQGAATTETGVEEAWKGYADIVNTLDAASRERK